MKAPRNIKRMTVLLDDELQRNIQDEVDRLRKESGLRVSNNQVATRAMSVGFLSYRLTETATHGASSVLVDHGATRDAAYIARASALSSKMADVAQEMGIEFNEFAQHLSDMYLTAVAQLDD
jgi:hypothetical protein